MASSIPYHPRKLHRHPPALTPDYKTSVGRSPRLPLLSVETGLSEITGPAFSHASLGPLDNDLVHNFTGDSAIGERTIVHGTVSDENGRPVPGALIEIWQANAGGRYRHVKDGYLAALDPNFGGCGRCMTDAEGRYSFRTVKPGAYPFRNHLNSWRMAHIHLSVFGAGLAQRLITQMYFEGDPLRAQDPIAQTIPDAAALDRLVAPLDLNATMPLDALAYRFDILLRGRRQTYFENRPEGA